MIHINFHNDSRTKQFILGLFDKTSDEDERIVEKDTGTAVLNTNGQEMLISEFGGIKNGSEIFVKEDISSLVDFYLKHISRE